jgi:pilus assembly protein TadC
VGPDLYVLASAFFAGAGAALAVTRPPSVVGPAGPSPPLRHGWRSRIDAGRRAEVRLGLRLWLGIGAGLAALALLLERVGWVAWLVAVVVGAVVSEVLTRLESGRAKRYRRALVLQTPQVLDLLAATLTAGLPLRLATAAVVRACPGPVADTLASVLRQIDLGVSDVEAWRTLIRHPQWGAVAADLARSVESGTMLTGSLSVHADEARAERAAAVEIAARQVGVRSVLPLMLCFIPAFLLLGIVPTVVSAVWSALAL